MLTSMQTPSHETAMSRMVTLNYSSFLNAAKDAVATRKDFTVFVQSNSRYVSLGT
jgi:hypothetical protein